MTSISCRPLFLAAEIRILERQHAAEALMKKAGAAVAANVQRLLPQADASVLVLAGPGNNGGDALVAARLLQGVYRVSVVFCGDVSKLPTEAADAYQQWMQAGGTVQADIPGGHWDLVIDGLFGIGLQRQLTGKPAVLVHQVNALGAKVLAIDVPSGICADTGKVMGDAIRADLTLTFLGLKPGLFTLDGPDHAGALLLEHLGIECSADNPGHLIEQDCVGKLLPRRLKNANKGNFGNLGVVGGAARMTGAAILAARAGLLAGAGRVYLGLLDPKAPTYDSQMPELMLRPPPDLLAMQQLDCLVMGPGMGAAVEARELLAQALALPVTLLLDADALNLLALNKNLHTQMVARKAPNIVTPHPGEAARMLHCSVEEVQHDRIQSALRIAALYQSITVLKGCGSVVAMPDGRWFINTSGNPGLSSAGMGDALAGIMGALIAQGLTPEPAVLLATYVHGAAADLLVERGCGPVGLSASEVMTETRHLLNQWVYL